MYNANKTNKVRTFTPIFPIGIGATGTELLDALYDIFNYINEQKQEENQFSDYRINEMIRDFVDLTDMNDWIDGEYIVFADYKIKIEIMAVSKFESLPDFGGY